MVFLLCPGASGSRCSTVAASNPSRPLGDSVDVSGNLLGGQQPELLPRPRLGLVYFPDDGEIPLLKRRVRRQAGGEDREAVHQVLVSGLKATPFRLSS
jgi:hypothetical protein